MFTKKDYVKIILFILGVFGGGCLLTWLLIEFAPYLLILAVFPAWLVAALADGAKIK